jgi:cytochrome c
MRFFLLLSTFLISACSAAPSAKAPTAIDLVVPAATAKAPVATATDVAAAVELAKASGCYSCHANAEKVVGPAFAAIAAKYSNDKDAAASLAQSIQNGSKGKWGRIPMPGNPSLSAGDIKILADWVLTVQP